MNTSSNTDSITKSKIDSAFDLYNAGKYAEAHRAFKHLDSEYPKNQELLLGYGVSSWKCGDIENAQQLLKELLSINPEHDLACRNLALIYLDRKSLLDAEVYAQRSIIANPNNAQHYFTMGLILSSSKKYIESESNYNKALELQPHYPEAHHNIGIINYIQGKYHEATDRFIRAISQRPDYGDAFKHLIITLRDCYDFHEALILATYLIKKAPHRGELWHLLGSLYHEVNQQTQAIECLRKAILINPNNNEAQAELATILRDAGLSDESRLIYSQLQSSNPEQLGLSLRRALTFPIVLNTTDEIKNIRTRIDSELDELLDSTQTISNPLFDINLTNFYLTYQGCNDRLLQTKLSSILRVKAPSLNYTAPHLSCWNDDHRFSAENLATELINTKTKIRLGIVSRYLTQHSIGALWGELISRLDHKLFEIHLFYHSTPENKLRPSLISSKIHIHRLPLNLTDAQSLIAEKTLDILLYLDIGMDPLTYFLAFARLAPLQCVTWGHPSTTGISTLDYFISSELLETPQAQSHYCETLITLPSLNIFFEKPSVSINLTKEQLNIPSSGIIYGCPQNICKIHPDMDFIFRRILQSSPDAHLILVAGEHPQLATQLLERLKRNIPDVFDQIIMLPRLSSEQYLSLLSHIDVMLDPLHFGGGVTTLQALSFGTPIVTLPQEFMRSRITYACYKQCGISELIAHDAEHYIQIATQLGRDPQSQKRVKDTIISSHHSLFSTSQAVTELEECLIKMVENKVLNYGGGQHEKK